MEMPKPTRLMLLTLCLSLTGVSLVSAQTTATKPFEPQVGQQGKDVVWVPTPQVTVDKMLDLAKVGPNDFVMDLGSGDGRTVITAAKRGATAMGIEYNPDMVEVSKKAAADAGVTAKATFMKADLFETDLSKATVITMFLLPQINLKLRPKILDLKPGTRVASNTFTMDDWEPDQEVQVQGEGCTSWCTALFWVVPAKVEGSWRIGQSELFLKQHFQKLTGTLQVSGSPAPITNAKLNGEEITFSVGGTQYSGRVNGNSMQGKTQSGESWTATRVGK